jgi:hypothetical protein
MPKNSPKDLRKTVRKADASYLTEDGPNINVPMDTITDVTAPNHPNPEMQREVLQISDTAKDAEYQDRGRIYGEALSAGFGSINPIGNSSKWAVRNILLNKFGLAKSSKNMKCRQCGSQRAPSKLKEVAVDTYPGFDYQCKNNCTNFNSGNNPYGAPRRNHR